jgi:hypothetical protein
MLINFFLLRKKFMMIVKSRSHSDKRIRLKNLLCAHIWGVRVMKYVERTWIIFKILVNKKGTLPLSFSTRGRLCVRISKYVSKQLSKVRFIKSHFKTYSWADSESGSCVSDCDREWRLGASHRHWRDADSAGKQLKEVSSINLIKKLAWTPIIQFNLFEERLHWRVRSSNTVSLKSNN